MDSPNFIMVIFTIFYIFLFTMSDANRNCNVEKSKEKFYSCIKQWALFREKRPSTSFLTDDYLIEEICLGGVTVKDMDNCIKEGVEPACDSVHAYWKGIKDKYTFICKWRKEFINHYRCRSNMFLTKAIENCITANTNRISSGGDYCESNRSLRKCLFRTLRRYCSYKAQEFFQVVFDLELAPSMLYTGCKEDFHTPAPVQKVDLPEEKVSNGREVPSRRKQNGVNMRAVIEFENTSAGNRNCQSSFVTAFSAMILSFILFGI